jgi:hypothetical protein
VKLRPAKRKIRSIPRFWLHYQQISDKRSSTSNDQRAYSGTEASTFPCINDL